MGLQIVLAYLSLMSLMAMVKPTRKRELDSWSHENGSSFLVSSSLDETGVGPRDERSIETIYTFSSLCYVIVP